MFVITLVDTRWTPGPSFFPDGRVIPQMLNCSASLRGTALAYSGDPRTATPLAGLNVRNLASTSQPFNGSLGSSPELSGNAGLDEMPRLVSVRG